MEVEVEAEQRPRGQRENRMGSGLNLHALPTYFMKFEILGLEDHTRFILGRMNNFLCRGDSDMDIIRLNLFFYLINLNIIKN